MNAVLVLGGAGYIGSHMLLSLKRAGFTPIVIDDFSTGHPKAVKGYQFIQGNINDSALLEAVFSSYQFSAVMHFASFIQVGESFQDPQKYYLNNVSATLTLLSTMLTHRVRHLVYSSSAAVYGNPSCVPIPEDHVCHPISPYGRSKNMIEQILSDFSRAYDFHYIALRYFNAAGVDGSGCLQEEHQPETHLIPLVIKSAHQGLPISVYGNDYPTPDGTCIRDYVHVSDLCDAHLLALKALWAGKESTCYNLGLGRGYSVQEVIDEARLITGKIIKVIHCEKRAGDPPILIADATRARQELGWQPYFLTLHEMIKTAYAALQRQSVVLSA